MFAFTQKALRQFSGNFPGPTCSVNGALFRLWCFTVHIVILTTRGMRLYFLCQLRKFNLPQDLLKQFYSAIIESVLCSSITVWFGSATKTDIRRLQRTVRTAERIIGAPLPNLQDLYISRVRKRAKKVTLNPSHPAHSLSLNCCPLAGATDH